MGGADSEARLEVYLTDQELLGDRTDPRNAGRYRLVGVIGEPRVGWAGSVGSERLGYYERWVDTEGLDLSRGTWVELELVCGDRSQGGVVGRYMAVDSGGSGGRGGSVGLGYGSVGIDDLAVDVEDCGGICMEFTWDNVVDEEDFMVVMSSYGCSAGVTEDLVGNRGCLEGVFSRDGYIDVYDVQGWDWVLRNQAGVCLLYTSDAADE